MKIKQTNETVIAFNSLLYTFMNILEYTDDGPRFSVSKRITIYHSSACETKTVASRIDSPNLPLCEY